MAKIPSIAIVGYGAVGKALHEVFPAAVLYDPPLGMTDKEAVNACEYAFVSVPTPSNPDGSCNTSIVEEVVSWLESDLIVIRSTIPVGTTTRLKEKYGKNIIFQPEYGPGETPDHPFKSLWDIRWLILGGDRKDTSKALDLYQKVFNADIRIAQTSPEAAELCKYMENTYLAMKVIFCNEFFEIANAVGVEYSELRELWLMDPRMGRSHTFVFPESRGFGGKCLPKDVLALLSTARDALGEAPTLLEAIWNSNVAMREEAAEPARPRLAA